MKHRWTSAAEAVCLRCGLIRRGKPGAYVFVRRQESGPHYVDQPGIRFGYAYALVEESTTNAGPCPGRNP